MNRQNGDAHFLGNAFADGFNIISNQTNDARAVDKSRFWLVVVNQFQQCRFQLFFTTINDIHLLQIRGKTITMKLGAARQCPANIPGVGCAANGAMHQMQGVCNRIEHHPRTAENTRTLAD